MWILSCLLVGICDASFYILLLPIPTYFIKKSLIYLHISFFFRNFAAQNVNTTLMPSADVQKLIPQIQAYLATQPVERAYLFGSCSRGEETPDSDIDILVSLVPLSV